VDPKLRPFATDRQWEVLETAARLGSDNAAAKQHGVHHSCIGQARKSVMKKAALAGYAPDHGMTRTVPYGLKLKKTSIYFQKTDDQPAQWLSVTPDEEQQHELIKTVIREMCEEVTIRTPSKRPALEFNKNLMNVIPWGDPHFGLHCWQAEVGNNFDLKIAKRDLCSAVDHLVSLAPPAPRCVLVNLGDFFHADNMRGVTERSGHHLDVDNRPQKMVQVGVSAVIQCIHSALQRHEQVEIVIVPGNHDDFLSVTLGIATELAFKDDPRVIIHNAPSRRQYLKHGKVMIGVTHGDTTKDPQLMGIMATEKPEWWGETKHRVFMRGHHHQDRVQEFNGGKVEQFRTLAPGDAYAVGAGYLSGRDMKLITYHSEFGEVSRATCGIELLRSLQA